MKPKANTVEVQVNTVQTTLRHPLENISSGGHNTLDPNDGNKGKGCQIDIHIPSEEECDKFEHLAQIQADVKMVQLLQDELS